MLAFPLRRDAVDTAVLAHVVGILFVGPAALLAVVSVAGLYIGMAFGDMVFALTAVTVIAWFLAGSRGGTARLAATSRMGALAGLDTEYARSMADGSLRLYASPGVLVIGLTSAVILGWIVVLVAWLI